MTNKNEKIILIARWVTLPILAYVVGWGILQTQVGRVIEDVRAQEVEIKQIPINAVRIDALKEDINELKTGQATILEAINKLKYE